jgi:phage-related minor tail protein
MADIEYGLRLTADGSAYIGNVKLSEEATRALQSSMQGVEKTADEAGQTMLTFGGRTFSVSKGIADQLKTVQGGLSGIAPAAKEAGEATKKGMDAAAQGGLAAALSTAQARRELIVLGHEALTGNFARMPGSFLVLAERMKATGDLINPMTLGFVALGGAVIGLIAAIVDGRREMEAMNTALALTSNYAGLTRGGMEQMAASVAASSQLTIGAAKDIVTQFVASGRIGGQAIAGLTAIVDDFAHATGQDSEKATAALIKIFTDPLKGAEQLNQAWHFLSGTQLNYIRDLEQSMRTQEAQLVLLQAVTNHLPKHAEQIGIIERAYIGWKKIVSDLVDALGNLGKQTTTEAQMKRLQGLIDTYKGAGYADDSREVEGLKQSLMLLMDKYKAEQQDVAAKAAAAEQSEKDSKLQTIINGSIRERITLLQRERDQLRASGLPGAQTTADELNQQIINLQKQLARPATEAMQDRLAESGRVEQQITATLQAEIGKRRALYQAQQGEIQRLQQAGLISEEAGRRAGAQALEAELADEQAAVKRAIQAESAVLSTRFAELDKASGREQTKAALAAVEESEKKLGELVAQDTEIETRRNAARQAGADAEIVALGRQQAAIRSANDEYNRFLTALDTEQQRRELTISLIGKTREEQARANAEFDTNNKISAETLRLWQAIEKAQSLGNTALEDDLTAQLNATEAGRAARVRAAGDAAAAEVTVNETLQHQIGIWQDISDTARRVWDGIFNKGKGVLDSLKDLVKKIAYEMTLERWVFNVALNVSGAGVANAAFPGQAQALAAAGGSLPGVGQGVGVLGSIGSIFTAGGTLGTQLGAFGANVGLASSAGLGSIGGISGLLSSGAGALMAAVPWAALAAVAIPFVVGLFDKGPAQRTGTFGSNAGLGGGNPAFQSSSAFGTFGIFNDKWFSNADQGKAISDFLAGIQGIDNAISSLVGKDTTTRIHDALAAVQTEFEAGIEHQATGFGDVMKQRYSTVAHAIDEQLGQIVDNFTGTGEELGKFVVQVVSVHEALKTINAQALFGQDVSTQDFVNLTPSGGDPSQTFSHLVDVFTATDAAALLMGKDVASAFGDVGLASAASREQLVNFAGGVQQLSAALAGWQAAGFTDTERLSQNTTHLNDLFSQLGITTIPRSWHELNTLIQSQDLNTEAGRSTAAILLTQVVPAFTAVYGTAQQAADAANQQAEANRQLAGSLHQTARSFMSDAQAVADDWGTIQRTWTQQGANIFRITGFDHIPTVGDDAVRFWDALGQAVTDGVPGAAELATTLENNVAPAIDDLNGRLGKLAATANSTDVGSIISGGAGIADKLLQSVDSALSFGNLSTGDKLARRVTGIANQIAQLEDTISNAPDYIDTRPLEIADQRLHNAYDAASNTYARYVSLVKDYGADIGGQLEQLAESFDTTRAALANNPAALRDAQTTFDAAWQAIINGTKAGVTGTIDQLAKLQQGLVDFVNKLQTGDLSPLSGIEKFRTAQNLFNTDAVKAGGGDLEAFARLQDDASTYLQTARDMFASSSDYVKTFNEVTSTLSTLGTSTKVGNDASVAIAKALPLNSTLASAADIADLRDAVLEAMGVLSGNQTATTQAVKDSAAEPTPTR